MAASIRPPVTPRKILGDDRSVQRCFLRGGNPQVAFDNALLRANQGIANNVSSACRTLDRKIQTILSAPPSRRNIPSPAAAQIAGDQ